jgi:hypothetical protein
VVLHDRRGASSGAALGKTLALRLLVTARAREKGDAGGCGEQGFMVEA